MFTSRAEFRILLRQDNADLRLTEKGFELGLASQHRYDLMTDRKSSVKAASELLDKLRVDPSVNHKLDEYGSAPLTQRQPLINLLKRPEINIQQIVSLSPEMNKSFSPYSTDVLEQVEIQVKYDSYIKKEESLADKMQSLDQLPIKDNFNYDEIKSLSAEGREKLKQIQPQTIGQASRISGVSPADISIIMVHIGR